MQSIDKAIDPHSKQAMLNFMRAADFSICDFTLDDILPDNEQEQSSASKKQQAFNLGHKTSQDTIEYFKLHQESDGTQKTFALAAPWLDTLQNGYVLVMDEMNHYLHPTLAMFMVKLFYNNQLNQQHSQLIFTTHETSLLTHEIVRRDQIWLMNKQNDGSSGLTSLLEFSAKKGENLRKRYLDGRYGGIPLTNDNMLIREIEGA